jgi:hypothetical protein
MPEREKHKKVNSPKTTCSGATLFEIIFKEQRKGKGEKRRAAKQQYQNPGNRVGTGSLV